MAVVSSAAVGETRLTAVAASWAADAAGAIVDAGVIAVGSWAVATAAAARFSGLGNLAQQSRSSLLDLLC